MALSSASSLGDWRLLFIQRDRVAAVTAADVNRVAKAYFQKPNRTVGLYIPAKESTRLAVPSAPRHRPGREGLQGRHRRRGGRSLRPLARQSRFPDQDRQRGRPESRPVAQEESRRDGLARADPALRQRRIAQGPDDRGRNAPRPDDGRHEETRSPGAARGARCARASASDPAAAAAAAAGAAVAAAEAAAAPRGN